MRPREILPGVHHWTTFHPNIRIEVSSYWIAPARVLLDPLLPAEGGLEWLRRQGPPSHVILTNRHHWRGTSEITTAFDCQVWCHADGLDELAERPGAERVHAFRGGDVLPGGIEAYAVGVLCPDESALRVPLRDRACLAVADGVIRNGGGGDGLLAFVPDSLLADDPADAPSVKAGLCRVYAELCELEWDTLLLAHGLPIVGDGRERLREFTARCGSTDSGDAPAGGETSGGPA